MPFKEPEFQKRYYSIGEVSEELGLARSLLRFWEKEFVELKPKKNGKGNRVFTIEDIQLLKTIKYLVKDRKLTLEGARQKLKETPAKVINEADCVERLKRVRDELVALRNSL